MVLGYHIIFGTYGFWLPNDPRGSWSDFVGAWELFRFGPATTTRARNSVAAKPHDRSMRLDAKRELKYPQVVLSGIQAAAVGRGFAATVERLEVTAYACSILPQHVHLVIARHRLKAERLANLLKGDATRELKRAGLHPLGGFPRKDGSITVSLGSRRVESLS